MQNKGKGKGAPRVWMMVLVCLATLQRIHIHIVVLRFDTYVRHGLRGSSQCGEDVEEAEAWTCLKRIHNVIKSRIIDGQKNNLSSHLITEKKTTAHSVDNDNKKSLNS